MRNEGDSRYSIAALVRGLEVLSLFTQANPTRSLTDIVQSLGMTKSTAYRVLTTLEVSGYVERDATSRQYRPGLKVLELGFVALNSLEVRHFAQPYLEQLASSTQETASLAVLDGTDIVYLSRVRNRAIVGILLGIGSRVSAHCTGLGKILLADLEEAELDTLLEGWSLEASTPHTIVSPQRLKEELAATRNRGYAINDQELAIGLRTVAASIRDRSQRTIAAIGVSGPVVTMSLERIEEEIAPAACASAAKISRDLGAA